MSLGMHIFEPGAMSIIQMGEELIGHPSTAINELVKNGYDADATECKVFVNYSDQSSFVLVADNGLGMHTNILFGDWLRPSVSSKRLPGAKSEIFHRSYLGSKGIGRLAAMALGNILTVVSRRDGENKFNWLSLKSDLFRSEQLLSKIDFPGDTIDDYIDLFTEGELLKIRKAKKNDSLINILSEKQFRNFNEGTLIIIENIDDSLKSIFKSEFKDRNENEDAFTLEDTSIYRGLSILITPLELTTSIQNELLSMEIIEGAKRLSKAKSTFKVKYGNNLLSGSTAEFDFIDVKPISILDKYDYRTLGKVTTDGKVEGKYLCSRLAKFPVKETLDILPEEIFVEEAKNRKQRKQSDLTEAELNANAGEFYFDIRVYDIGEEDSREKLRNLVPGNSASHKDRIIESLLGLRISKNGFGVKPYGEEVKDWLGLGQLRVQDPGKNVSTNQILGYIFFYSPENDGLKEKTNREGFYENKAFADVKFILQSVFRTIGRLRYNYRLKHSLGRIPKSKFQRPDSLKFLTLIQKKSENETVVKKTEEFINEITTALDNMEDTLTLSQRLASLGTGLELVYHELAQPIAKIGGSRALLKRKSDKIENKEVREDFIKEITSIGSYVAELDELKSSLKPAIGKSRVQVFKPVNTFRKVCHLFRKDFEEEGIIMKIQSSSENFELEDHEYAFWISFLNIINNAVYWLKLNETGEKIITFSIERGKIVLSNNGPLIPMDYIDLIFDYGFTLKKEKNATGLGLAFTRNILNLNKWNIDAENRDNGPAFIMSKYPKK